MRIGVIDKIFLEWASSEEGDEAKEEEGGDGRSGGEDDAHDHDTQPQPFPMVCHEHDDDAGHGGGQDQAAAGRPGTVGPRKAAASASAAAAAPASSSSSSSAAAATSWCFLWPVAEEGSDDAALDAARRWGAAGRPAPSDRPRFSVGAALEHAAAAAANVGAAAAAAAARDLARRWMDADAAVYGKGERAGDDGDRWLRGLHSLRFSDGPEWIRGGGAAAGDAAVARARGRGAACVIWATSAAALHSETLSDAELLDAESGVWPSLCAAFPALRGARRGRGKERGGDKAKSSALPTAVVRSRWGTDERFLGSYSYQGPGAGGEEAEALAAPLLLPLPAADGAAAEEGEKDSRPVVLFAGEHTSREYMGTVHGAMESGKREAARLLAAFLG
jgi:hypothetical protein